MAWTYIPEDTPVEGKKPGEPYVLVPPARSAVTMEPPTRSPRSDIPGEADTLYGRVRAAEGTAKGSGYVYYGGDAFTPGAEHPGEDARRSGPQGTTHAAGPGQWQPDTWNGLKPEFRTRFGRDPVFGDDADQKRMTWLNAGKVYPGGESALQRDIAEGKLDTSKLAGQWAGFNAGKPWSVTQSGKWKVSDKAIASEQGRGDTSVVWMSPQDYLGMTPEAEGAKPKRRSLLKSLEGGDEIEAIPSLDAREKNGRLQIIDQDGRNRAQVAIDEGVDLIPVAIHGAGKKTPEWVEDMRGNTRRYNFREVPKARGESLTGMPGLDRNADATQAHVMSAQERSQLSMPERILDDAKGAIRDTADKFTAPLLGAAEPVVGTAQLAAHGAEAIGVPGAAPVARGVDNAAQRLSQTVADLPTDQRIAAGAGNVGSMFLAPSSAIANLPRLARPFASGGVGAASGLAQPVTGGNFWGEKAKEGVIGALAGGAAQTAGEAVNLGRNMMRRFVTRSALTDAAGKLVGLGGKELTPEAMRAARTRISSGLERIESGHDVRLDNELVRDLGNADQRALDMLGNEARPIHNIIDNILSRARGDGVIPAKSAATTWHKGSRLDNLTESRNPDISMVATDVQAAMRRALNRQLSANEAAEYSQLRHEWRDMKIIEKSLRPGQNQISPERFVNQVNRRFPDNAYIPEDKAPAMLRLGRAVGETWEPGAGSYAGHAAGSMIGGAMGHAAGGFPGAVAGTITGNLLVSRLLSARYASRNAMASLRPGAPPQNLNLGQYAAPLGAASGVMSPAGAR